MFVFYLLHPFIHVQKTRSVVIAFLTGVHDGQVGALPRNPSPKCKFRASLIDSEKLTTNNLPLPSWRTNSHPRWWKAIKSLVINNIQTLLARKSNTKWKNQIASKISTRTQGKRNHSNTESKIKQLLKVMNIYLIWYICNMILKFEAWCMSIWIMGSWMLLVHVMASPFGLMYSSWAFKILPKINSEYHSLFSSIYICHGDWKSPVETQLHF